MADPQQIGTTAPGTRHAELDYDGRVALVTGGARGVGRGIAEALLEAGATVVVCGRHQPAELPCSGGRQAEFVVADVRQADQVSAMVDSVVGRHGRLDVMINNAGGSPVVPAADASARFVTSVVALNLLGPFFGAQAANRVMQAQSGGGSIINIGSVSGERPSPGTAAYGAAKAGVANLTRTLAVEWAPKVRVNCVVGGLIATEAAEEHYGGAQGLARVAATVPLGRLGTPWDLGQMCLFLASPLAAYVSGAVVEVHGGGEAPPFLAAAQLDRDDVATT